MTYRLRIYAWLGPPCIIALSCLLLPALSTVQAGGPAADGAAVYFISPADGDVVSSPVLVQFGLRGMGVAPAGIQLPSTGHHHLLINTDLASLPTLDAPIPSDDQHRHFGQGQTETMLELPAGEYRLQLLLGDFAHVPHAPPLASDIITITVK